MAMLGAAPATAAPLGAWRQTAFQQQRPKRVNRNSAQQAARCQIEAPESPASSIQDAGRSLSRDLASSAVNTLFAFKPFFDLAKGQARSMMIKRGDVLGVSWESHLNGLRSHDWDSELLRVQRKDLTYPEYYLKPFHAYDEGNLCWSAAWEAEVAATSVHAPVMDPEAKLLDPHGDVRLRQSYHRTMKELLPAGFQPRDVADLGSSVGLSTFALLEAFPGANVIGVDLSPYFLSVANYNLQRLGEKRIQYHHGAAEDTRLPDKSMDLVSICLVCHELPQAATRQIIEEAHQLLRPGGALAIMEMNPASPFFKRIASNVFTFAAFKSTEPYLDQYMHLPLEQAIAERGFHVPRVKTNSPRHKTLVAIKK
eukprot:jgi/Chlat1/6760/Chrsp50S06458